MLQTRLRYVLFIPWLMKRATEGNASPAEISARFRGLEYQLINALTTGGEKLGVIGNTALTNLKRMPSSVYWAAMGRWNIRNGDLSTEAYFRRQYEYRRLANRTARADDPETRELLPNNDLDLHLPAAPAGWLGNTSFALRPEEEQYLSDRIAESTTGSMLAWLIGNQPDNSPDYVWHVNNLVDTPEPLRDLIDHARRFHTAIYGAAVLYNLLLARKGGRDELVGEYEVELGLWRDELQSTSALEGWSRTVYGPPFAGITLFSASSPSTSSTPGLTWPALTSIWAPTRLRSNSSTHVNEDQGGRGRLVNQAALDRWSGRSGLGRLDYRWPVARRHLNDLYEARPA